MDNEILDCEVNEVSTENEPVENNRSATFSIIGFVFSCVGVVLIFVPFMSLLSVPCTVVGFVFSIIALVKHSRIRGLAKAGLIISGIDMCAKIIYLIFLVFSIVFAGVMQFTAMPIY